MDYTLMLCGKDAFSYFFLSTWRRPPRSWAKWQKPAKKLDEEIREIDWPYLFIHWTVWQIFNIKHWPETKIKSAENLFEKKLVKSHRVFSEHIFGGF